MELRDQLPADKRVPFDDIFKLVGSVDELNISDLDLKTELIQEAEVVMRTMIGTLTSIPPKNTIKLSTNKGDVNMTPFMIGYIGSALALDETERSRLGDALSTHESPNESLRHHLSEEQYQLMIELTRGRRFHELSESEREEPLDLMDDINSLF